MLEWVQTYLPNVYNIGWTGDNGWLAAINATLYMTIVSFIIGGLLGLLAGLFLVLTGLVALLKIVLFFKFLIR